MRRCEFEKSFSRTTNLYLDTRNYNLNKLMIIVRMIPCFEVYFKIVLLSAIFF